MFQENDTKQLLIPQCLQWIEKRRQQVWPKLAQEIGFKESIVLRQLDYAISTATRFRDNKFWFYETAEKLKDNHFPFFRRHTIDRVVWKLKRQGLIHVRTDLNKWPRDRTRHFAIHLENVGALKSVKLVGEKGRMRIKPRVEPCTVLRLWPHLAAEIELIPSLILLQLDYWIKTGAKTDPAKHLEDGRFWTWHSVREMSEDDNGAFRFLGKSTVNRAITDLEERKLIDVKRPAFNRPTRFAINYGEVKELDYAKVEVDLEALEAQWKPPADDDEITRLWNALTLDLAARSTQ